MSDPVRSDRTGLAGIAVVALAVACCAAGPLLVAAVGSIAVGALVGVDAALALLVVAFVVLFLRHRKTGRSP